MMRIGYSFWGFVTRFTDNDYVDTPDCERGNRVDFVDELFSRGYTVVQLQQMRDHVPYVSDTVWDPETGKRCRIEYIDSAASPLKTSHEFPDVDIVFVEWRWPTYKNSGDDPFEPDYLRQLVLLDHYHERNVPIVIHDGDLTMTPKDEACWPNAFICDPCINPRCLTRKRFSLPWCNYMRRVHTATEGSNEYVYVGNNYLRDAQFSMFYGNPATRLRSFGIQTKVYGNWLQRSPERGRVSELISKYPNVAFAKRIAYREIFDVLNEGICTTHITIPRYIPHGNITNRYHEAIKAGLPALILDDPLVKSIALNDLLLVWDNDSQDTVDKVRMLQKMPASVRASIVDEQEIALRKLVDLRPEHRVDVLERIAEKGLGFDIGTL